MPLPEGAMTLKHSFHTKKSSKEPEWRELCWKMAWVFLALSGPKFQGGQEWEGYYTGQETNSVFETLGGRV